MNKKIIKEYWKPGNILLCEAGAFMVVNDSVAMSSDNFILREDMEGDPSEEFKIQSVHKVKDYIRNGRGIAGILDILHEHGRCTDTMRLYAASPNEIVVPKYWDYNTVFVVEGYPPYLVINDNCCLSINGFMEKEGLSHTLMGGLKVKSVWKLSGALGLGFVETMDRIQNGTADVEATCVWRRDSK